MHPAIASARTHVQGNNASTIVAWVKPSATSMGAVRRVLDHAVDYAAGTTRPDSPCMLLAKVVTWGDSNLSCRSLHGLYTNGTGFGSLALCSDTHRALDTTQWHHLGVVTDGAGNGAVFDFVADAGVSSFPCLRCSRVVCGRRATGFRVRRSRSWRTRSQLPLLNRRWFRV